MRCAIHVYAVVRLIRQRSLDVPENALTIKEVVPTQEEAEREVVRLNSLNAGKDAVCFWQLTRFFPEGRGEMSNESRVPKRRADRSFKLICHLRKRGSSRV